MDPIDQVAELCQLTLPVLAQQIDLSRTQVESAILQLTQQFGGLHRRVQCAAQSSLDLSGSTGGEGGVAEAFKESEGDLRSMLDGLRAAFERRDQAMGQVAELANYARSIESMASQVSALATRTNLLALNAAIEAARAGAQGRGFAVVADEVRNLSTQSRMTGDDMSEKAKMINSAMARLVAATAGSHAEEKQFLRASESSIQQVLSRLRGVTESLTASTGVLQEESRAVGQEIEQVLVALQFQDRVSQILAHTRQSLDGLNAEISTFVESRRTDDRVQLDSAAHLQRIAKGYTTPEQRQNHRGQAAADDPSGDAVTFF